MGLLPKLTQTQRLSIVISISSSFFIIEIAVGFKTQSLVLIADAFHYLTDLVGLIVALVAIRISVRGKSPKSFSFGWQRAKLLGAFFNGAFLAALGLSIFLQAVERFVSIQKVEDPKLVLIIGAVGLGLNIISGLFLHDHEHDYGNGGCGNEHVSSTEPKLTSAVEAARPSFSAAGPGVHATHHHTKKGNVESSGRDLGLLGVLIHVIGDAINNIGVMVAAAVIWWSKSPARFYADPAISMGISFMIIGTSFPLTKRAGRILLQTGHPNVNIEEVRADLQELPGVSSVHELHIWRLNERKTIATAHIVTEDESLDGFIQRAKQIGECLHAYGVHSYTLQPEPNLSARAAYRGQSVYGTKSNESEITELAGQSRDVPMAKLRQGVAACQLKYEQDSCQERQCCD